MKRQVLFLCTGNSARSQMAEAIVNAHLGDTWQAHSAGTRPAGYVHPSALRALAELGIQHDGRSKGTEELRGEAFDLVVTVCDSADDECPLWLGPGPRVHMGFPDPARVEGNDEEVMAVFRALLAEIARRVPDILRQAEGARGIAPLSTSDRGSKDDC